MEKETVRRLQASVERDAPWREGLGKWDACSQGGRAAGFCFGVKCLVWHHGVWVSSSGPEAVGVAPCGSAWRFSGDRCRGACASSLDSLCDAPA